MMILAACIRNNIYYIKYTFHTSPAPRGGCRGFPHTNDKLSNCQKRDKRPYN